MGPPNKKNSAESQSRRIVEEVMQIARSGHASAALSGGSRPRVIIVQQGSEMSGSQIRSMLSGIEFATRAHFSQDRDSGTIAEWTLKSRFVDVTVRCVKTPE